MSQITNKTELYRALAEKLDIEQKEAKIFYEGLVEVIQDSAIKGDDETYIHLPAIGRINIRVIPPHMGINPKTQEKLLVHASRRPHLRFFPQFTKAINSDNKRE